jgi:hypothetical protein
MNLNPDRRVLVHRRWRTIHELHPDGTTRCGNAVYKSYVAMRFRDTHRPPDRRCARCVWITEPEDR